MDMMEGAAQLSDSTVDSQQEEGRERQIYRDLE
jgi:hypothetical protein